MKRTLLLSLSLVLGGATAFAQFAPPVLPPGASAQGPQDPGYKALIATCKTPQTPPAARPGAAPGGGGATAGRTGGGPGGAAAAPTPFPPAPTDYTVTEIQGVIAAGQKWTKVWEVSGNNADGVLADKNGDLLIAQNHNSAVVRLDKNGKASTVYSDTHTGGALSMNKKGELFIVERGLHANVSQLAPKKRILADKLPNGDPLDCLGGVINDLSADSKGGAYFTMGPFGSSGLFYADAKGVVAKYGESLNTNGVILSTDEKTLYVTNGSSIAAFDVEPDGTLKNQRKLVDIPRSTAAGGTGGGPVLVDGLTVDSQSRLYVTAGRAVHVVAPDGKLLGSIPAPYALISAGFAGPDKKTLYAVVSLSDATGLQHAFVYSIAMVAQGYKDRAK